jgi:hypothetical protein
MIGSQSLVVQALIENRKLNAPNIFTWSNGIKAICNLIGQNNVWVRPNILCKNTLMDTVKSKLCEIYNTEWYTCITKVNSKLRTYCKFKLTFSHENYVRFLDRNSRSTLCKLRISAHKLMIEMGRYTIPKTVPENRLCTFCDLHEVEDEFHFMMKCTLYEDYRGKLLSEISEVFDVTNLSDNDIFLNLMCTQEYDIIKSVSKYVDIANSVHLGLNVTS